jgi:hypothetical protein
MTSDALASLAARFDAERAKPREGRRDSRADALVRGRMRYLQILGRRVCAKCGLDEPFWVNDPLDGPGEERSHD